MDIGKVCQTPIPTETTRTRAAPIPTFRPGIHHGAPDFFFFVALIAAAAAALASFGTEGLGIVFPAIDSKTAPFDHSSREPSSV
jgi:hypothetical protein